MPKTLCSKVKVKSNSEHPSPGPKPLSASRTQVVVMADETAPGWKERREYVRNNDGVSLGCGFSSEPARQKGKWLLCSYLYANQ